MPDAYPRVMRRYIIRASGLAGAARGALCAALDSHTPISGFTPRVCADIPNIDLRIPFHGLKRTGMTGREAAEWNITHCDLALIIGDDPRSAVIRGLARSAENANIPHVTATPEHVAERALPMIRALQPANRPLVIGVEGGGVEKRLHARTARALDDLLYRADA